MSKTETVQIIRDTKGVPIAAVLAWDEYERLKTARSEDAALIAAGNAGRGDETYPANIAARLVAGENPLKVIREWRGLTQAGLYEKSDVATQYISQIERGDRNMGRKTAAKLAPVLGVSADILMAV